MAIVINGSGTVTGLSVGGLPDGTVDAGTLATDSVDSAELVDGSIDSSHLASGVGGVAGISSSADATAITIDSSENVGIGVVPKSTYSTWMAVQVGGTGNIFGEKSQAANQQVCLGQNVYMDAGGDFTYLVADEASYYRQYAGTHTFFTAPSGSADATLSTQKVLEMQNDGRMLAGEGTFAGGAETLTIRPVTDGGANDYVLMLQTGTTGSATIIRFFTPNGVAGVVSTSGSNTSYGTSSDYRLKENVDYDWDATTRLKQLKPARFNWIEDDTNTLQDGFIAHEVSSVVPEAISGEKDGMETYTDENGDEKTRIAPQSIDQSKLVPLLVKTIQELEARITALEA